MTEGPMHEADEGTIERKKEEELSAHSSARVWSARVSRLLCSAEARLTRAARESGWDEQRRRWLLRRESERKELRTEVTILSSLVLSLFSLTHTHTLPTSSSRTVHAAPHTHFH